MKNLIRVSLFRIGVLVIVPLLFLFIYSERRPETDLSPRYPIIFEWTENGKARCELWYPNSKYYFSCEKISEEIKKGVRHYNGAPPEEFGFPHPEQRDK